MRLEDGTMVCCFDLKKSRKSFRTWLLERICELVIIAKFRREISQKVRVKARASFPLTFTFDLAVVAP